MRFILSVYPVVGEKLASTGGNCGILPSNVLIFLFQLLLKYGIICGYLYP